MSYVLKTDIANKNNYGGSRRTSKIKYIVIHYTANDGDTDESNAKYFKNNIVKSSAHYFVDDDSVTQSVSDDYIAWHCGGSRYNNYKTTGGAKYYKQCTNTNSIGIELCDTVKDGKYGFTKKTIENAVELIRSKMEQYNIPLERVIRHFDVTGKICPSIFVNNEKQWDEFKNKIAKTKRKGIVAQWQEAMNKSYNCGLAVDNSFGPDSESKANRYYLKYKLITMKNDHVKYVQERLNKYGYKISTDSSYGPKTRDAVKKFQKSKNLKQDGFVGANTTKKLLGL